MKPGGSWYMRSVICLIVFVYVFMWAMELSKSIGLEESLFLRHALFLSL